MSETIDIVATVDTDAEAQCDKEDINSIFYAPGTVLLENTGT